VSTSQFIFIYSSRWDTTTAEQH